MIGKRNSKKDEFDRLYNNKPKIMLEVISAKTMTAILLLTYAVFIFGFALDLQSTVKGFTSANRLLGANDCLADYTNVNRTDSVGCQGNTTNTTWYWSGVVTDITNVISTQLIIDLPNVTASIINPPNGTSADTLVKDLDFKYDIVVYCCLQSQGCGDTISSGTNVDQNSWNVMLIQTDLTLDTDSYQRSTDSLSSVLYGYTFQNQEALPTRGKVKSYLFVLYVYQTGSLDMDAEKSAVFATYTFNQLTRQDTPTENAFTMFIICITIAVFSGYVYVMRLKSKKWLPEQRWLVLYFVVLVLYQNPVYIIAVLQQGGISISTTFASYCVAAIAQSVYFIVWLLFSDVVRRKKTRSTVDFYGPKIAFGCLMCVLYVGILLVQFVSLYPSSWNTDRSSVEAVENWKQSAVTEFFLLSMAFFVGFLTFLGWWYYNLRYTGRKLAKLPYVHTRYLQLSYRFFFIQATLVALYYAFQYILILSFVMYKTAKATFSHTDFMDDITNALNTLFREQSQLFGNMLFLSCYGVMLAFVFLPVEFLETDTGSGYLASTYVISKAELEVVVAHRKEILEKNNVAAARELAAKAKAVATTQLNYIIQAKADVFCVDVGLMLLNASYEAYYDPPNLTTKSGFGIWDVKRHGFEVIDVMYQADHETFCYIVRYIPDGSIIVSFRFVCNPAVYRRIADCLCMCNVCHVYTKQLAVCYNTYNACHCSGTSSSKHWNDNLNYKRMEIDFQSPQMTTSINALDQLDDLHMYVKQHDDLASEILAVDNKYEAHMKRLRRKRERENRSSMGSYNSRLSDQSAQKSFMYDTDQEEGEDVTHRNAIVGDVAQAVAAIGTNVADLAISGADKTKQAVMDAATSNSSVLRRALLPHVHSGFWDAYSCVRCFLHAVIRREYANASLGELPHLYFTGHSLGGALATLASVDVTLNSMPRIKKYLEVKRYLTRVDPDNNPLLEGGLETYNGINLETTMYSFGSPRVGNGPFSNLVNQCVPDSFRVVVDGDIVPSMPRGGYKHIGTQIMVDSLGFGSIIIDPSYVERRLQNSSKTSVSVHSLVVYRKALLGVKSASYQMSKTSDVDEDAEEDHMLRAIRMSNTNIQSRPSHIPSSLGSKSDVDSDTLSMSASVGPSIRNEMDEEEYARIQQSVLDSIAAEEQAFLEKESRATMCLRSESKVSSIPSQPYAANSSERSSVFSRLSKWSRTSLSHAPSTVSQPEASHNPITADVRAEHI